MSTVEQTATMINSSDFKSWNVEEVVNWCISSLDIEDSEQLCNNILEHDISGEILAYITLEDCKELCGENLKLAISLKLLINKLLDSNASTEDKLLQEQEENMTVVLKNLYGTLSHKLQDYQSQYARLRVDILEVVKSKSSLASPQAAQIRSTTEFFEVQPHSTVNTAISPTRQTFQQPKLKSQSSSSLNSSSQQQGIQQKKGLSSQNIENASAPGTNEPLKQLRASKEDSCERILKNAMKRHNLSDQDWRQYILVICYGDQERALDLNEKPVVIFKSLKLQGLHPAIMLRRRGDFEEVQVNSTNSNGPHVENPIASNGSNSNTIDNTATPGGRL